MYKVHNIILLCVRTLSAGKFRIVGESKNRNAGRYRKQWGQNGLRDGCEGRNLQMGECVLIIVEEKEGKRSPDKEHQNIQPTVLASSSCLPELLVTLVHRGCRGYRVLE